MHAMLQGQQPPQEVLSYYVHGNPFIQRDGHPSEYTLGDMRTAYATRLAVSNQYQRHKPDVWHNPSPHTQPLYSPVPNQMHVPLVFQPQAAPHSFHPGYFSGSHHMTPAFHDPNQYILPQTPPTYFHVQHHTAQARTPPTPALTEDQRSAATSPDRPELYSHQPNDAAWVVHAALTHPTNTRAWQPQQVNLAPGYEDYQEPVYTPSKPGVGPNGHVLGGLNIQASRYSQPLQPTPVADRYVVWEHNGANTSQPAASPYIDPQAFVSMGHAFDGYIKPQKRTRGVGPNGHVLGGGSKEPSSSPSGPDVLYDTAQQGRGQPGLSPLAPRAQQDSPPRLPTGPLLSPPDIVLTSASTAVQSSQATRTRPRALSRISSMNLRNELDTVVEEEEPVPSPRVFTTPIKQANSFLFCEENDDGEDASTDAAVSEVSVESASDVVQPSTPQDSDHDGFSPFVVLSSLTSGTEDIRYYDERETVVSADQKDDTPVVNIPRTLGVPNVKPLSRKAQRRAARH